MWKLIFILGLCVIENDLAYTAPLPPQTQQPATMHAPQTVGSLQRGAKYFMHFCSGCHSLKLMRYDKMAEDLQIIDKKTLAGVNNNLKKSYFNGCVRTSTH